MRKSLRIKCFIITLSLTMIALCFQGCAKKCEIPFDCDNIKTMYCEDAVQVLRQSGFENLTERSENTTEQEKDGLIKEILIDGKSTFKKADKFEYDTPIEIVYFKLKQIDVYLDMQEGGEIGKPEITINTNLPNGTKLKFRLENAQKAYKEESKRSVHNGQAKADFRRTYSEPLTPGDYVLTVDMEVSEQPLSVLKEIGKNGEVLKSDDLSNSDQAQPKQIRREWTISISEQEFLQKYPTGDSTTLYELEKCVQEQYGKNYIITKDNTARTEITIWKPEYSECFNQAKNDNLDELRKWYEIRKELENFAKKLQDSAPEYWVWVYLVDNENSNRVLLSAIEDTIKEDALRKKIPVWAGSAKVDYVGAVGYVAVRRHIVIDAYDPLWDINFATATWKVPTFKRDKQLYVDNGTLDHKTEVEVIEQNLKDRGHDYGTGYLTVKVLATGEIAIIDVHNFVTIPYWELDVESAASIGECVAEYHQKSDYWPVSRNKDIRAPEGARVLIYGMNKTDGLVWSSGLIYQNGESVVYSFQPEDLAIIK